MQLIGWLQNFVGLPELDGFPERARSVSGMGSQEAMALTAEYWSTLQKMVFFSVWSFLFKFSTHSDIGLSWIFGGGWLLVAEHWLAVSGNGAMYATCFCELVILYAHACREFFQNYIRACPTACSAPGAQEAIRRVSGLISTVPIYK